MTTNLFHFAQGNDGTTQYARLTVPGCGRNEKDDAPVVIIEIEKGGTPVLKIYGDIKSSEPTHEIPLSGAQLSAKSPAEKPAKLEPASGLLAKASTWTPNLRKHG